jgi:hypothetical protein
MKKDEFNARLREFVRSHLSPNAEDRAFVSEIYKSIKDCLGEANCLQIGSYPRYTAIRPLHDLDVLFIAGKQEGDEPDPSKVLASLKKQLENNYRNPTKFGHKVELQTHSITLVFLENQEEFFSVDIVPAYIVGKNEFQDDTYLVPELLNKSHRGRRNLYREVRSGTRRMTWIKSDPRGYITVASQINQINSDFRKAVKFVKAWRASCKEKDDTFALKSFHIEQVLTEYFRSTENLVIYDAIFKFFCELPEVIKQSKIPDRADPARKIDAYIDTLSEKEKDAIIEFRDCFLIKLEYFSETDDIRRLLDACRYRRQIVERFLFDYKIPTLIENDVRIGIRAHVLPRKGGFTDYFLDKIGLIKVDRSIEFRTDPTPPADIFKWKVRNDDSSEQPRGEITDHHTRYDPEHTKYKGKHYVECYAIRNGVCIARVRQDVVLESIYA